MNVPVSERLLWKCHFNVQFCLCFCQDTHTHTYIHKADEMSNHVSREVKMCSYMKACCLLCADTNMQIPTFQSFAWLFNLLNREFMFLLWSFKVFSIASKAWVLAAELYLGLSLSFSTLTQTHVCVYCMYDAPTSWSGIFLSILTSFSEFPWLTTLQNKDTTFNRTRWSPPSLLPFHVTHYLFC